MTDHLPEKYRTLVVGGVLTLLLVVVLRWLGVLMINPTYVSPAIYVLVNILGLVFCWLVLTFLIRRYPLYRILLVVGAFIIAVLSDQLLSVNNNPISTPLMVFFWLGATSFILPQFFKKYKIAIIVVYGLVLSYHLFDLVYTEDYRLDDRLNFFNFILMPIPFFAALWFYEQWRWLKMLQADKAKVDLALLKSQINPHFFFNTLNNLYGLVVEKSEKAPAVVLKLSDMMRYTIYKGKEDLVLLGEEVEYLENYIDLHRIRYHKKVEIAFSNDIEEGLKIAPLLFIILLENAFKHGLEKVQEGAFIRLDMQSKGNRLCFTIENRFDELANGHPVGIGLQNLKKRLAHSYPNRHQLVVEQIRSVYKVRLDIEL